MSRRFLQIFYLISLFLSVTSGNATSSLSEQKSIPEIEELPKSSNKSQLATATSQQIAENDDNDDDNFSQEKDVTLEELLLFESLIDSESIVPENIETSNGKIQDGSQRSEDIIDTSETPTESRIAMIRRKGDLSSEVEDKEPSSSSQFDDSRDQKDSPLRFGQKYRDPKNRVRDEVPLLQLTQGGYQRPYERSSRFTHRQTTKPDSSEQSEKVQKLGENSEIVSNRPPTSRRITPQIAYSGLLSQQRQSYPFIPSPNLRSTFNMPLNNRALTNQLIPTPIQNSLFNSPQHDFLDYTNPAFQPQFPTNNDITFDGFSRDPNSAYTSSPRNPFQNTELLFQSVPQVQPQSILFGSSRQQLSPSNLPPYPSFANAEDVSRRNIASYFNNPALSSSQFQAPPNFYGSNSNEGIHFFNSQPVNFLPNYPNLDTRFPSEFYRYPIVTNAQNQQSLNDQQQASDTSQEDKRAKQIESKEDKDSANDEAPASVGFGSRLQPQKEGDVFIRYPTNEAGYAVEENMPPANGSQTVKETFGPVILGQRSFPTSDPYRDALATLRSQSENKTRHFIPEELFRDVPIDFGYQRPQPQIFVEYPDRNRDISSYPTPDLDSRGPFNQITPLSQNNYPFLSAVNQRRGGQNLDSVPQCAKPNNASFCFEDEEYPRTDILYSVNSNSFLMDRLSGTDLQLDSAFFVEQNTSGIQSSDENYACPTDTKYGAPLRGKSLDGSWKVIVNLERFTQPLRMEVCRSIGDSCSYTDNKLKTTCVQKYSAQRLLAWSPDRGIFSDVFKIPVACSCQILQVAAA